MRSWSDLLILPLLSVFFWSAPAKAYLTSDFDFNFGYVSFDVDAGEDFNKTMDSLSAIEFNYSINISGPDVAATVSFFELLSTDFGPLAFTRLALGLRWYFLGLNGERLLFDSTVEGKVWRPTPFAAINFGMSNLSVDDDSVGNHDFNADFIDTRISGGVEVPVASNWLLLGQFGYLMTLVGGTETDAVSVSGFLMMAGIRVTGF